MNMIVNQYLNSSLTNYKNNQSGPKINIGRGNPSANSKALSNITPSMMGLRVGSVYSDMQKFQDVINTYSYGKASLIKNPENFKIYSSDGDIYLDGFYQSDMNVKEGICEELTYKAGKELQDKFGDRYIFFAVQGRCSKYSMHHSYITAVERNPENEKRIQDLLDKQNDLAKLRESMNTSQNIELLSQSHSKADNLYKETQELSRELLSHAILIDPSFHIVKQYSEDGSVKGYVPNYYYNFEAINPYKKSALIFPEDWAPIDIPIGYASEIAPDLGLAPKSLLFLSVEGEENSDDALAKITSMVPDHVITEDVDIPEGHILYKFINSAIE